jgi:hypothetical protein
MGKGGNWHRTAQSQTAGRETGWTPELIKPHKAMLPAMGKSLKFPSPITNAKRSGEFNTFIQASGLIQDIWIGMDKINCSWLEVVSLNPHRS